MMRLTCWYTPVVSVSTTAKLIVHKSPGSRGAEESAGFAPNS